MLAPLPVMDCEVQEGEQAQTPRAVLAPKSVPEKLRIEHELLGHAVFRSWCRHCSLNLSRGVQHRRLDEEQSLLPEFVMDYFFMGQDESKVASHLAIKDRRSGYGMATCLDTKTSEYAVASVINFIRETGYKRLVLKSDQEPSILKLKARVTQGFDDIEIVPKESVEYDPRSNGAAEQYVNECKGRIRVLKTSTEDRLGRRRITLCWLGCRFMRCRWRIASSSERTG